MTKIIDQKVVINLLVVFALFFVHSCSLGTSIPKSQNNACEILDHRKSWTRAVKASSNKWGVSEALQLAFIRTESNFRPRARTPRKYLLGIIPNGRISSAYGYAQALDGTWDWYKKSSGNRSARRSNFSDATDFIGWYVDQSTKKLGIAKSDVYNQYLAYHEGHVGFSRKKPNFSKAIIAVAKRTKSHANNFNAQLKKCK